MTREPDLQARLASIEGLAVTPGAELARLSTFRIGGRADLLVEAGEEGALRALLTVVAEAGETFQLLGLGSNVLLPDEGLRGVVVRLGGAFREVSVEGHRVTAGAAVTLARIARDTAAAGLAGLEPLAGFPSTVGGAVFMNAGCYGTEIVDLLVEARVCDRYGKPRVVTPADLEAGYRRTVLQRSGELVLEATFELAPGDPAVSQARIEELNAKRWDSLPSGNPNVGSIFRNPPGDYAGRLIEECGLKGQARGGARISPRHANVIVNEGGARAIEVLDLMVAARRAVEERFGVALEPEVVLAGGLRAEWERRVAAGKTAGS